MMRVFDYARAYRAACGHLVGWPGVARLGFHEISKQWFWCDTCDKRVQLPSEVVDWEDGIDRPKPKPKPRKKAVKKDPKLPRRKDGLW